MSTLADRLPDILRALDAGRRAVLATLVHARGSSPAAVGARLIIDERGEVRGTVGGGCLDGDVLTTARKMLSEHSRDHRVISVDLTGREEHHELSCGGIAEVYLEVLREPDAPVYRALAREIEAGRPAVLVTYVGENEDHGPQDEDVGCKRVVIAAGFADVEGAVQEPGSRLLPDSLLEAGRAALDGDRPVFSKWKHEPFGVMAEPVGVPTLLVLGCGHVGTALCEIAAPMGFRVVMVDDREAFANDSRLPEAHQVRVLPFERLAESLEPLPNDAYVVIVTRGHKFDTTCLRWALTTDARYIGMIGSRAKIKRIRGDLADEGVAEATLTRLHSPIGLSIGARTVEEIAVSIAAELVAVRRLGASPREAAGGHGGAAGS